MLSAVRRPSPLNSPQEEVKKKNTHAFEIVALIALVNVRKTDLLIQSTLNHSER